MRRHPDLPLPETRYLPGRAPHPGHGADGLDDGVSTEVALGRGLDLLAAGYPWEAHEALERAWHRLDGTPRRHVGGWIKLCAGWVRLELGDRRAARTLLERATQALHDADALLGANPGPELARLRAALEISAA